MENACLLEGHELHRVLALGGKEVLASDLNNGSVCVESSNRQYSPSLFCRLFQLQKRILWVRPDETETYIMAILAVSP